MLYSYIYCLFLFFSKITEGTTHQLLLLLFLNFYKEIVVNFVIDILSSILVFYLLTIHWNEKHKRKKKFKLCNNSSFKYNLHLTRARLRANPHNAVTPCGHASVIYQPSVADSRIQGTRPYSNLVVRYGLPVFRCTRAHPKKAPVTRGHVPTEVSTRIRHSPILF